MNFIKVKLIALVLMVSSCSVQPTEQELKDQHERDSIRKNIADLHAQKDSLDYIIDSVGVE